MNFIETFSLWGKGCLQNEMENIKLRLKTLQVRRITKREEACHLRTFSENTLTI